MIATCNGEVICGKVKLANTFFTRLKGLMGQEKLDDGEGLLIIPCNQVHTFRMKFSIDIVTLGENDVIIYIDKDVKPGKIRKLVSEGKKVLELKSGAADSIGLNVGQIIEWRRS